MHHLIPRYHLRPPRGFLNDPNGPLLVDGTLHLYYQYRFTTETAEPVVWGHATSADLVHWTLHRPAMAPMPGGADADGCWSGVTVATGEGIRAFYSGFREDAPLQATLTALSTDGGASFGEPRVAAAPPDDVTELRDPFLWRDGGRFRMAVGAGAAGDVASIRMWESDDLETWEPAGVLAELPRTRTGDVDTGSMWECPQVLDLDGTTVALVGTWASVGGALQVLAVLPGREGDRLDGLGCHPVDDGTSFYAPSVLRDGPRGPLLWGWIVEDRDEEWWREDGWAGTISLPREVRLGRGGRLLSAPAEEVALLRQDGGVAVRSGVEGAAEVSVVDGIGAQFEVEAVVRGPGGLRIRCGDEVLEVRMDASGSAVVDRSGSSRDPRAHSGEVVVRGAADGGAVQLRLFVDGSVIELFTGTGRTATTRFYPTTPPPWSIEPAGDIEGRVYTLG